MQLGEHSVGDHEIGVDQQNLIELGDCALFVALVAQVGGFVVQLVRSGSRHRSSSGLESHGWAVTRRFLNGLIGRGHAGSEVPEIADGYRQMCKLDRLRRSL